MSVCDGLSVCRCVYGSIVAGNWSAAAHARLELTTRSRPMWRRLRTFRARSMSHRLVVHIAVASLSTLGVVACHRGTKYEQLLPRASSATVVNHSDVQL